MKKEIELRAIELPRWPTEAEENERRRQKAIIDVTEARIMLERQQAIIRQRQAEELRQRVAAMDDYYSIHRDCTMGRSEAMVPLAIAGVTVAALAVGGTALAIAALLS